jgi:hypothetical protein
VEAAQTVPPEEAPKTGRLVLLAGLAALLLIGVFGFRKLRRS